MKFSLWDTGLLFFNKRYLISSNKKFLLTKIGRGMDVIVSAFVSKLLSIKFLSWKVIGGMNDIKKP